MTYLLSVGVRAAEEPKPLLPETAEIIIGLVAFVILLWIITKKVVPVFEKMYAERTEAIEGGLVKAEEAQAQAAAALEQYQAQLADARGEAGQIREEARTQGASILAEMRQQAQAEADRLVANAQVQIEAERSSAIASLHAEVGTLASQLAEKIVGESLTDDERQQRVIDRFLADLESESSGQAN
ncbi:MAG: F0F1 ATP synthase subunit B [Actinomycetia bacterium]|nr:F0F1 ATP synthase subunit B [Actinomycetes bacterium]